MTYRCQCLKHETAGGFFERRQWDRVGGRRAFTSTYRVIETLACVEM